MLSDLPPPYPLDAGIGQGKKRSLVSWKDGVDRVDRYQAEAREWPFLDDSERLFFLKHLFSRNVKASAVTLQALFTRHDDHVDLEQYEIMACDVLTALLHLQLASSSRSAQEAETSSLASSEDDQHPAPPVSHESYREWLRPLRLLLTPSEETSSAASSSSEKTEPIHVPLIFFERLFAQLPVLSPLAVMAFLKSWQAFVLSDGFRPYLIKEHISYCSIFASRKAKRTMSNMAMLMLQSYTSIYLTNGADLSFLLLCSSSPRGIAFPQLFVLCHRMICCPKTSIDKFFQNRTVDLLLGYFLSRISDALERKHILTIFLTFPKHAFGPLTRRFLQKV